MTKEEFKADIEAMADHLRSHRLANGYTDVFTPTLVVSAAVAQEARLQFGEDWVRELLPKVRVEIAKR